MSNFYCHKIIFLLQFFGVIFAVFGHDDGASPSLQLSSRIVGGEESAIINHPYVVSVRRKTCDDCPYVHYCGGTIFKEDVIITASNCVLNVDPRELHIVAGSSLRTGSLQDGGMIFPVSNILVHPSSNIDLALLHLAIKIPLNNKRMQAVSLATKTPKSGSLAVVVGWGKIEEIGPYSERLREASVPIVDHEECVRSFEWTDIEDHEICAGFPQGGVDACHGDAGGPLLVDGQLVGVTSWGYGCARPGSPGVYTNVVHLSEWIISDGLGVRITFF